MFCQTHSQALSARVIVDEDPGTAKLHVFSSDLKRKINRAFRGLET